MKAPVRRRVVAGLLAAVVAPLGGVIAAVARGQAQREIEIVAQRFRFTPNEIHVRPGEKVTLAIRSLDFVHGFNVPDLGLRADLVPGRVTRVELQPTKAGTIAFLCDNFCGDGHEEMSGRIVVGG